MYKKHDVITKVKFAFLPRKLTDETLVWLESYREVSTLEMLPFRYMYIGSRVINRGPGLGWVKRTYVK